MTVRRARPAVILAVACLAAPVLRVHAVTAIHLPRLPPSPPVAPEPSDVMAYRDCRRSSSGVSSVVSRSSSTEARGFPLVDQGFPEPPVKAT